MDYFAVIFKNADEDQIRLPHRFVRKWGQGLKNPLKMKTTSGRESRIRFKEVDGSLFLCGGWHSFAQEYKPQPKDVILFEYTGHSQFVISFFKSCGMEKFTPLHPTNSFPAQFFKPFMKNEYYHRMKLNNVFNGWFESQLRNPLTIYCNNGAVLKVEFKFQGSDIWLKTGWKEVVANCDIYLKDFLFFKYIGHSKFQPVVVNNRERPLICTSKRIDDHDEHVVIHEQFLWSSKITKSVRVGNQPLNIHVHVVHELLNGKPDDIDVMIPSEAKESWKLLWYEPSGHQKRRPNQCLFGHGWYEYAKRANLKVGQKLKFYRRSNEDFLRVEIIHGEV